MVNSLFYLYNFKYEFSRLTTCAHKKIYDKQVNKKAIRSESDWLGGALSKYSLFLIAACYIMIII